MVTPNIFRVSAIYREVRKYKHFKIEENIPNAPQNVAGIHFG